ncbi:Gfo/Idh/MocA family oxidoreductase [Rhizobium sp. P38BS-XIX]|uniref:Gfo/Idh/MocA family protein n=1 Tax=Rhizobium sp. P38BS-XIX TaxID=2726740 RepID=UPI0014563B91|nr:Gfo/Idh/MocA family oxidoreductase [Rhizobium sp. P38BS-XIX]NLS00100.1 Gfo/Idh/MocA family oxidoreductase [Rhizobium sp. P38BS-XIX]
MTGKQWNVGIIGCGHIFDAYARLSAVFKPIRLVACADVDMAAAERRGKQYGLSALSASDLLARQDIDVVINLTNPASHATVTEAILKSGKHAYTEKPLALTMADADHLLEVARQNGRLIGSAPDTFLGGAHQAARRLVDEGKLGIVKSGSAHFMNHGMEHWHPNPFPYFQVGAGPVLDMGPYYMTALVALLGPVRRVIAMASKFFEERHVTAEGPAKNTSVPVTTPTTSQALLEFSSGAQIHFSVSYDNWGHGHTNPIELHGTNASLMVPDPNYFGGGLTLIDAGGRHAIDTAKTVFGNLNWQEPAGATISNYRGLGLADLLVAAESGQAPRASGDLSRHVLEVLLAIIKSAEIGEFVEIKSTVERPAPLSEDDAALLKSADAPSNFAA